MGASLALAVVAVTGSLLGASGDDACAAGGDHVRVMLMDLKAAPAYAGVKTSLGQIVAAEAAAVPGYQVLSAEEVRTALDQEANKALAGCDDSGCLAEIAQALDAELVVAGGLERAADGAALVSLTLLNAKAIVVVNRVSMTWAGPDKELPDVVRAAADTLMLEAKARPPGALSLKGLPADAVVLVDGVDRTSEARGATVGGLAIGPHDVKVDAPGKVPWVAHAVVKAGKTAPLPVVLEDAPASSLWVWLGGGGAVLAGGALALGLAYALGPSDVDVHASVPRYGPNDVEALRKP